MHQRRFCKRCHQPITEEMLEQRRLKKVQNALNSRAKAKANGNPIIRKAKANRVVVRILYGQKLSIKDIAERLKCSPASVYRALRRAA